MKEYEFRGFYIPERMMHGIRLYIDMGVAPGHFLTGIITNNLRGAVGGADDENIKNIPAYIGYFYNEAPSGCWGSIEIMDNWIASFNTKRKP